MPPLAPLAAIQAFGRALERCLLGGVIVAFLIVVFLIALLLIGNCSRREQLGQAGDGHGWDRHQALRTTSPGADTGTRPSR